MRRWCPGWVAILFCLLLAFVSVELAGALILDLERQAVQVSELFSLDSFNFSACPCSLPFESLRSYLVLSEGSSASAETSWSLLSDGTLLYEPGPAGSGNATSNTTILESTDFEGALALFVNSTAIAHWTDYTVTAAVNASANSSTVGIVARARDVSDFYLLLWTGPNQTLTLERLRPGFQGRTLATSNATSVPSLNASDSFILTLTAIGRGFQASLNGWSPWGTLVDTATDAMLSGTIGLFASGDSPLLFQNWTVDGTVQVSAATPAASPQSINPVPSVEPSPAWITPVNETHGIRLAYTLYFPAMNLSDYAGAIDVVIRSALDTRLGFQTTWLVGVRAGSVYASYYSLVTDSSPYASANGTALASARLQSYVCGGRLTFDTGILATCPSGTIDVAEVAPTAEPAPSSSSSSQQQQQQQQGSSSSSSSSNAGVIGGVVASVVLGLAAVLGALYYVYRRRQRQRNNAKRRLQRADDEETELEKRTTLSIAALSSACGTVGGGGGGTAPDKHSIPPQRSTGPKRPPETPGVSQTLRSTPSLREALRMRFVGATFGSIRPRHGCWETLVLDARCTHILAAVCRLSDLADHGITGVESLEEAAQLKNLPSRTNTIFLVTGDDTSLAQVAQVCTGLSPRASSSTPTPTSTRHQRRFDVLLLAIRSITSPLLDVVRTSLGGMHASLQVRELHADLVPIDDYAFSFELPELFGTFYGRNTGPSGNRPEQGDSSTQWKRACKQLGDQLASVLQILGLELPKIEIHTTHIASSVAMGIADALRAAMNAETSRSTAEAVYVTASVPSACTEAPSDELRAAGTGTSRSRYRRRSVRLVLIDRATDPLTPLRHDLAYDAFLHDMFPVPVDSHPTSIVVKPQRSLFKTTSIGSIPLTLNTPDDPTWLRLRYLDIHEAASSAHVELDRFLIETGHASQSSQREFALGSARSRPRNEGSANATLGDKSVVEYQRVVERLSFHLDQLEKCTALYQSRYMASIVQLEAILVTGKDPRSGKKVRRAEQQQQVEALLQQPNVEPSAKLRLILLWVACRGADANLLVRWMAKAQIDDRGRASLRAFIECLRAERHSAEPIKRQRRARDGAPLLLEILGRCAAAGNTSENPVSPSIDSSPGADATSTSTSTAARAFMSTTAAPSTTHTRTQRYQEYLPSGLQMRTPPVRSGQPSPLQSIGSVLEQDALLPTGAHVSQSAMEIRSASSEHDACRNCAASSTSALVEARPVSTQSSAPSQDVLMIFFIGGLTRTECRIAATFARQMPNLDVYIGGTHLLTPSLFLDNLADLVHKSKVAESI